MAKAKRTGTGGNKLAQLTAARDDGRILRIHRRTIDVHHLDVFVVGVGSEWVLVQPVRDRIDLDGYEALRLKDITKVEDSPRATFLGAVLKLRKQKPKAVKKVALDTVDGLLLSASRGWQLVAVHREKVDPDVCEVGRVREANAKTYVLHPVDLEGVFERELETFPSRDVTRVDFGNGYEEALAMAGGMTMPKTSARTKKKTSAKRGRTASKA
ncbi:hypothetical protein AKJ09_00555 [Labilithrix luteola]|uniref:Uncharacterized protein n=1 Tax=Labilithrix luteola TaxID=1391654 RepID=A0A0K1PKH3_9BACT|nr:hypothetical protein [Labilithrix luteola]AKU93891.1 hypothetical protein AKJ09_00555 [Labilithrix luteola]